MKDVDPKSLMIAARKRVAKLSPQSGEVIQGIAYAFLNAGQQLKAAKALFDQGLPPQGFGHVINAVEEIGKMAALADALVDPLAAEKFKQFRKSHKSHQWKLAWALKMFRAMNTKNGFTFTAQKIYFAVNNQKFEGQEAIDAVLKALDPKAAEHYHRLRISSGYTNFDGQRLNSPYHEIDPAHLAVAVIFAEIGLPLHEKLAEYLEKLLPIFFVPLKESFFTHDQNKVSQLKREINRRVGRTFPALYMYLDEQVQNHLGAHLDELIGRPIGDEFINIFKSNLMEHVKNVAAKIVSDEEIPVHYFYPPLKDSFKAYYEGFTQENGSPEKENPSQPSQ